MKTTKKLFPPKKIGAVVLVGLAMLLALVKPVEAQQIIGSPTGINPAPQQPSQPSPWNVSGGILQVGFGSPGTLTIQNGGQVNDTTGYAGYDAEGTVMVDGAGSTWTNNGAMYVGYSSTGTLSITHGGTVVSTSPSTFGGFIGNNAGSNGTVTVDGPGSKWSVSGVNSFPIDVGVSGTGTLNITGGGEVDSIISDIGRNAGSTGTVTVDGLGSKWSNSTTIYVGRSGKGTLNITGGGEVTNTVGEIALDSGSNGTVTVDGKGSTWVCSGDVAAGVSVGESGTGTLNITGGGSVSTANSSTVYSFIGHGTGATGTVTIDGAGSTWTNHSSVLNIGYFGTGTMNITHGGTMLNTNSNGSSNIGGYIGIGNGTGTVTVDGPGSTWTNNGTLNIGNGGKGTLKITNGGTVSNTAGNIGTNASSSSSGTVTVDGTGSTWTNSGVLRVGTAGAGELTISNQAVVTANGGTWIGMQPTGRGIINIGAAAGNAPVAPGTLNTPTVTFGFGLGDLVFNHTDNSGNYIFTPVITGGTPTTAAVDLYAGTTVMTGVGSDYFGRTTIHGGTLAAGAASVFSSNSDYVVQGSGTMNLRGHNQTVGSLANAGIVSMGTGAAPGTILTVNGNYVGNGGTIIFNTKLGADNSPTDKLVVGSNTSGSTGVKIVNAGGLGEQTTGNGIEVVEVHGASNGQFSLTGPVTAGAFTYGLFQNGIDNTDGNWYLRSSMRPEVPLVSVVPALASRLGLSMLGTVDNRNGGFYGAPCQCDECCDNCECGNNDSNILLWTRGFGETGNFGGGSRSGTSNGGLGSAGPAYNYDFGGIQVGADLYRDAGTNAGLYFDAATLRSSVFTPIAGAMAGTINMDGYAFGSYWTHCDPNGWYTDLVLQGSWYENIRTHSDEGVGFDTRGWGITASAETGYVFTMGNGYSLIPQGQIVYQHTSINGGADPFAQIHFGETDETYGRLGARLAKGWFGPCGRMRTAWFETNFWSQFGDNATTTFATLEGTNPTTVWAPLGGTWMQTRLGLSGQLTHNVCAFGTIDYNVTLNHPGNSLGGQVGLQVAW